MRKIVADNYVMKTYLFSFILIFTISVKEITQYIINANSESTEACLNITSKVDNKLQTLDLSVEPDSIYSKNPGVEILVSELRQFVLEKKINYQGKSYRIKRNIL